MASDLVTGLVKDYLMISVILISQKTEKNILQLIYKYTQHVFTENWRKLSQIYHQIFLTNPSPAELGYTQSLQTV